MPPPESKTVPALLDEMARRYPDRIFIIDGDRRVTYRQMREQALQVAKSLHALGVRRGDRVALMMGNQLEWLQLDFAVAMLGGILVALNTWWRRSEIHHALTLSESRLLVMVDRFGSNDYTAELAAIGERSRELPKLERIVCLGSDMPPGAMAFDEFVKMGQDTPDAAIEAATRAVQPDDASLILFTSGSSGKAKAATLVHRGLVENPYNIGERMHLTCEDRLLLVLSLFWSASSCNALFNVMTHGASMVLAPRFDAAEALRLIQDERCTAFYTLPNIVHAIYQLPDRKKYDLSSLRTGICRSEVIDLLVEMGAQEFCTTYGLTEGYGHSCMTDGHWPLAQRRQSAGLPLPGTEVQIIDRATRQPLPDGQVGEVRVRGYVTAGYYHDPQRTREAIDEEGWLYTGDLGVFDANGFSFQGRIKEMIKTGGINVTPAEVEAVLYAHPGVLQAVVVGVPDPVRDEIVAAMVVPRPGHTLTEAELAAHCRQSAAAYKVPRFIHITAAEQVPLTDTGKVSKRHVQDALAEKYRATEAA